MHNAHLTGDLKLIALEIGEWAQQQQAIVRLWLYGSHARSTRSAEDGLEVAFEIDALPSVDTSDGFRKELAAWKSELSSVVGLEVAFEPIDAATIQDAVTDHGVLIYERDGAEPCRWLAS